MLILKGAETTGNSHKYIVRWTKTENDLFHLFLRLNNVKNKTGEF